MMIFIIFMSVSNFNSLKDHRYIGDDVLDMLVYRLDLLCL